MYDRTLHTENEPLLLRLPMLFDSPPPWQPFQPVMLIGRMSQSFPCPITASRTTTNETSSLNGADIRLQIRIRTMPSRTVTDPTNTHIDHLAPTIATVSATATFRKPMPVATVTFSLRHGFPFRLRSCLTTNPLLQRHDALFPSTAPFRHRIPFQTPPIATVYCLIKWEIIAHLQEPNHHHQHLFQLVLIYACVLDLIFAFHLSSRSSLPPPVFVLA